MFCFPVLEWPKQMSSQCAKNWNGLIILSNLSFEFIGSSHLLKKNCLFLTGSRSSLFINLAWPKWQKWPSVAAGICSKKFSWSRSSKCCDCEWVQLKIGPFDLTFHLCKLRPHGLNCVPQGGEFGPMHGLLDVYKNSNYQRRLRTVIWTIQFFNFHVL